MAKHFVSPLHPGMLQHRRFARNGTLVQGPFFRFSAMMMNHWSVYRRKFIAAWAQGLVGDGGGSGTTQTWQTYFHTGHNCDYIRVEFLMGRPDAGTDPYAFATISPASTEIVADTTALVRNSIVDAGSVDAPDDWALARGTLAADDDTAYLLKVAVVDFARVLSVSAWEIGSHPADDTTTGVVDPSIGAGDPIFDGRMDQLMVGQGELLRTNRSHVFSWCPYDGGYNSVSNTTYKNIFDETSSAIDGTTPGLVVPNQYHNTFSQTDVPYMFAVLADHTSGATDGSVKIEDAGATGTIEITGIDNSGPTWYTQTGTLPAATPTKYDVQAKGGGAITSTRVYAIALYVWE